MIWHLALQIFFSKIMTFIRPNELAINSILQKQNNKQESKNKKLKT